MKRKMILIKVLSEISNSFLPLLFWALIMFGFDAPYIAILTIISAIIHEAGHLFAMLFITHEAQMPTARLVGFKITKHKIESYKNEIIILLLGPIANIGIGFITLALSFGKSEYLMLFAIINILSGVSNLLPLEGYDGFNILLWIFESKGKYTHITLLRAFSFFISILLTFVSLYLVYILDTGYWLFLLFFVSMMNNITKKSNIGQSTTI